MMGRLAILRLHEQQFQIIRRAQVLRHAALRRRLFPQHTGALPSQVVEGLLIIINDGLIETALQFFQRHASRLRRCFGIVDAVRRVGESLFKTLRHPPKERFDRSFC